VQGIMQCCHLRRMGKLEFRVAWNDVFILHVTNCFGIICKGNNHKETAQLFLCWTQTVDYF
jgi:hypothetical protein